MLLVPHIGTHRISVLYAASAWAGFTVFEVARKAHGPDEEKPGVDSYSSLWGPGGAAEARPPQYRQGHLQRLGCRKLDRIHG